MNTQQFINDYNVGRNGANFFVRHPLVRQLHYSDGVQECAESGCHWLLDVIGTECLMPLRRSGEYMGIIEVGVNDKHEAVISMTVTDDQPPVWIKTIDYTDMPAGSWKFFLADETERFALILPTEY